MNDDALRQDRFAKSVVACSSHWSACLYDRYGKRVLELFVEPIGDDADFLFRREKHLYATVALAALDRVDARINNALARYASGHHVYTVILQEEQLQQPGTSAACRSAEAVLDAEKNYTLSCYAEAHYARTSNVKVDVCSADRMQKILAGNRLCSRVLTQLSREDRHVLWLQSCIIPHNRDTAARAVVLAMAYFS